ncbi:MAG: cystathionine beta-lyase [Chaenotheca gracillima]|nr:MAG: cystathionine beta-lyase [Chaenotheca gracillima]
MLEMDEQTFRRRAAIGSGHVGLETMSKSHGRSSSMRVHRGKLETLLSEGLDIRRQHSLTGIDHVSQGNHLTFENGQSIETSTLIGADGVHSQVRKLVVPQLQFDILPFVVYYGRRRLTLDHFRSTFVPYLKDKTVIESRKGDVLLRITVNEYLDEAVEIGYTFSRPARAQDPLHQPDRPNSDARKIPDELFSEIASLAQLEEPFAEVFDSGEVHEDRLLHWLMRSLTVGPEDLERLASKGVVLLGDSAHAMPILGGEGANAAIMDALEMAEHIASQGTEGLAAFQGARSEGWREQVERSKIVLKEMHIDSRSQL